MIDLGPHATYIILAYLGVLLVTAGLVLWTLADSARQDSRLAELEAMGVRRRSAARRGTAK
jgi:heme exporter protein D